MYVIERERVETKKKECILAVKSIENSLCLVLPEERKYSVIKLTCFSHKTSVKPHLEGHDLQEQWQQHHNLEVTSFHMLKLFQKYLPAAHHQQE